MPNRWLIFLSISLVTVFIFIFFIIYLLPIPNPKSNPTASKNDLTNLPSVTFVNPSLGPASAPVKIIVFSDFTCSACQQLADSLTIVHQTYPKQVQIVWKNLPNQALQPLALPAAIAAHCADQQNQFWNYHDLLFTLQNQLSQDKLITAAQEIELDTNTFIDCFNQQETLPIIERDITEAQAMNLTATPTLFINGQKFTGVMATQTILQYANQILE